MTGSNPCPDFWRGRRVLITGHTGFKGAWLSLLLERLGAHVVGFSLPPAAESPSLFTLARLEHRLDSHFGDIREADAILKVMTDTEPEIVIHLAAQALVRKSYEEPVTTYATNVLGLVHVLEATRTVGSSTAVLNVTSDKCYENHEWDWPYRENDRLGGSDPYSNSKACAELVTTAYSRSFFAENGISIATARAGNVIGGGDWAQDRIVPDAIRSFQESLPLQVRNPLAVRPWQHVLEPLSGYLLVCESLVRDGPADSQAWNFGPGPDDVQSVGRVADMLSSAWGGSACWTADSGSHPHEARLLRLDSSRARTVLGWTPRWALASGIARTVEWYKAFSRGEDVCDVSLRQIDEHASPGASGHDPV